MAIDTAAKRASATGFVVPSYAISIFPDGAITEDDRAAATWVYGGIPVALPAPIGTVELMLKDRLPVLWLGRRSAELIIESRDFALELPEE